MPKGFYSPTAWGQREPLPLVPLCGKCGLWQHCQSPKMPVSGKGRRKVLIVAEAPGETEDLRNTQLVGNAGSELVRILATLGVDMRKDCWLDNSLRCRPMDKDGKNRTPTNDELSYCRPNLSNALKVLSPDVIIPLGIPAIKSVVALAWKDGEVDDAGSWVGWQIPSIKLNAWICPTYHPSFLLHEKNLAAELHVTKHLRAAFTLQDKPYKTLPNFEDRAKTTMDSQKAADIIRSLVIYGAPLAFDYETTTLKPDSEHAEIICCSVSNGEISIGYPWLGEAIVATKEMIQSDVPKIAANFPFEDRWTRKKLGCAVKNWYWDIVLGAHWKRCNRGICSLKFQAFVLLGMYDYDSHLNPYMQRADKNSNLPNRLKEVELEKLLKYCSMDSLLEVLVAQRQMEGLQWK